MVYKIKNKSVKEKNDSYKIENKKLEKTKVSNRPKYLIEGYRWFDKINGNTYHTVIITDLDTGEVIHKSPHFVYGYDEQYRQTAYDELKKIGKVREEDRFNHGLNRSRFIYRVTDVNRKKDLF